MGLFCSHRWVLLERGNGYLRFKCTKCGKTRTRK
ncbi:Uncharacterised protein [[Clostridium] sordellii]|nr:Uncharacterised protein [[Clostridium] sordellii] [Paeniclostridium sordellii]